MPAILAILTFSKQVDINWDYIKDARRDISVNSNCTDNYDFAKIRMKSVTDHQ